MYLKRDPHGRGELVHGLDPLQRCQHPLDGPAPQRPLEQGRGREQLVAGGAREGGEGRDAAGLKSGDAGLSGSGNRDEII